MKALKIIGIIILILVILVAILHFVAPKEYKVDRTVTINAPKEVVFYHVKYWRNWTAWSPWAEADSTMKVTVEGIDGEKDSKYKWVGDPKITGSGEIINTGVKENEEIAYHLHFIIPWESESDGYVRIKEEAGKTKATWGMYGKNNFPWTIMALFMSMDKMIGKDFDRGMEKLKNISEKETPVIESYKIEQVSFTKKSYATIRNTVHFDDMQGFFNKSFDIIEQVRKKKGNRMAGAPVALYFSWDEQNAKSDMAAGIPIYGSINEGDVKTIQVPFSNAYSIDYYGQYSNLMLAHRALEIYFERNNLKFKPPVIEEYVTDPATEQDQNKWLTKIYWFAE